MEKMQIEVYKKRNNILVSNEINAYESTFFNLKEHFFKYTVMYITILKKCIKIKTLLNTIIKTNILLLAYCSENV